MRCAVFGLILTLGFASSLPANAHSPDPYIAANFAQRCASCWPAWVEIARPIRGVGPSTQNGLAFLFVNGSFKDPWWNREHLHFSGVWAPTEAVVEFQFNNATIGGRLVLTHGGFLCLPPSQVMAAVTDELFIVTLRDDGENWYGAFLGDFTLLDPQFAPRPEARTPYTTVGLLEKAGPELRLRAVRVMPHITRFSPIEVRVVIEETPTEAVLTAVFRTRSWGTVEVRATLAPEELNSVGYAGILYLVGNGAPCCNLVQREVAVRRFLAR